MNNLFVSYRTYFLEAVYGIWFVRSRRHSHFFLTKKVKVAILGSFGSLSRGAEPRFWEPVHKKNFSAISGTALQPSKHQFQSFR